MEVQQHQAQSAATARPTLRLLVVDDAAGRALCRWCLRNTESFTSHILEACTAGEAQRLCHDHEFDCLLVDDALSDTSGVELTRRLLGAAGANAPPVILMTGRGSEQLAIDALQAGCADYISKDRLTVASLNRAVENAVEKSSLRRAVESRTRSLQRSNEQLREKSEEIERFYHSVSHEIKTPLTAAREFIALTLEGFGGNVTVTQREFLEHALASCDDIARHFDDLLDATRLEEGKMRIRREPAVLATTITRAIGACSRLARDRGVALRNNVPGDLPPVHIDSGRIVQVIANLVHNAVKFAPPGGWVEVNSTPPTRGQVEVRVVDNGCGIGEEHLPKIFQRLYQAGGAEGANCEPGLGLGLYISREIVRLHGADIHVTSGVGKGSTFRFSLPLASTMPFHSQREVALS
jgi:signal transduction histidine kinase